MKLIQELAGVLSEAIYKPEIAVIGSNLELADMDSSPKHIAHLMGREEDLGVITKEYNELTKKHVISTYATKKFAPDVHKLIVGLWYLKNHHDNKTPEEFEHACGLSVEVAREIASKHMNDLKHAFPEFKISWIPATTTGWSAEFTPAQRKAIVSQEIISLAKNRPASVSGMDLAKKIKSKYKLKDDVDSLRRNIDLILSKTPHLAKWRVNGPRA